MDFEWQLRKSERLSRTTTDYHNADDDDGGCTEDGNAKLPGRMVARGSTDATEAYDAEDCDHAILTAKYERVAKGSTRQDAWDIRRILPINSFETPQEPNWIRWRWAQPFRLQQFPALIWRIINNNCQVLTGGEGLNA